MNSGYKCSPQRKKMSLNVLQLWTSIGTPRRSLISPTEEHRFRACTAFWRNSSSSDSPFPFLLAVLAQTAPLHLFIVKSNTAFPLLFHTFSLCFSFSCLVQFEDLQLILLATEEGWIERSGLEKNMFPVFTRSSAPVHLQFSYISVLSSCLDSSGRFPLLTTASWSAFS